MKFRSIKFKQQMADADCGAACLAMILSHHGHEISVASTKSVCEQFGPPQSSRSIVSAARSLGLKANLFSAGESFLGVPLPCMLYWRFEHFVVLVGVEKGRFLIIDPALGRRVVPYEEFDGSFTGIGIQFEKTAELKPKRKDANDGFRRYLKQALHNRSTYKSLAIIAACSFVLQAVSLALPLATYYLVDDIIPARATEAMFPILSVIGVLAVCIWLTTFLRTYALTQFQIKLDKSLLDGFISHLLKLPVGFFSERSIGDIQARMNATTVVRDWMSGHTMSTILDLVMAVSYTLIIAFVSVKFAALMLLLAGIQFLVQPLNSALMQEKLSAEMKTQASYQSFVLELLNGIVTIKGSAAEAEVKKIWDVKLNNYLISSRGKAEHEARILSVTSTVTMITPIVLFWLSVSEYFAGAYTLGAVISLNALANMALMPLSSFARTARHFHYFRAHLERLGDLWRHQGEASGTKTLESSGLPRVLAFDNVSFRYNNASQFALKNISLKIPLNKKIGIVGPSGSGKSTFLALVLGFYKPSSGNITVDGCNLKDCDIREWRKEIGYVSQNPFVFNSSIRNNIGMVAPTAHLNEIEWAANCASLHDDIQQMPMGYNTSVGESGVALSGGQRQRLSIARALIKHPKLLIFDEATSSLDGIKEQDVSARISRLDCAQILVAHRLSTVRHCDTIVLFDKGEIVAQGTHDELVRANEYYKNCVASQAIA